MDPKIVKRIKLLEQALGKDNLGHVLIEAGMTVGYPFPLYMPFVHDHMVVENNQEQTATNILSILYMSNIEDCNVLSAYREIAEDLFKSLDETGKVESYVIKLLSRIDEFRKVNTEKTQS